MKHTAKPTMESKLSYTEGNVDRGGVRSGKEQTMSELKRCPFCGDEVEIRRTGLYHWRYAIYHRTKTECILDTTGMVVPHEHDEAIRLWNKRSADRPQGEWIKFGLGRGTRILFCTNCERRIEMPLSQGDSNYDFCPNCGAKMKGADDE